MQTCHDTLHDSPYSNGVERSGNLVIDLFGHICSVHWDHMCWLNSQSSQHTGRQWAGVHDAYVTTICCDIPSWLVQQFGSFFFQLDGKQRFHGWAWGDPAPGGGGLTGGKWYFVTSDDVIRALSQYNTSNGSWRQGIKGEMTCTVYVALVWNIIYWIMMIITLFTE